MDKAAFLLSVKSIPPAADRRPSCLPAAPAAGPPSARGKEGWREPFSAEISPSRAEQGSPHGAGSRGTAAGAGSSRGSGAGAIPQRAAGAAPHGDTMAGSFPSQSPPMAVESPHNGRHPLAIPAPPGAAGGGSVRARALREGGKHCEPVHFPRFYYLRELDRTCKRHNCEVASTGPLSTETAAGGGRAPGGSGGPEQRHLAPLGPKKTAKCLKFIAWHLSKFATSETD